MSAPMKRHVTCPRCEGSGEVQIRAHRGPNGETIPAAAVPCLLCSGTGRASLLEPMRANSTSRKGDPLA